MKLKRVLLAIILLVIIAGGAYILRKHLRHRQDSEWVRGHTFILRDENGSKMIVNPYEIEEIKIKNPTGSFTFEVDEKGIWYITEPVHRRANQIYLAGRPMSLIRIEENDVVETSPKDLSKYALDSPDVIVQFRVKNSKKWHSLWFGRRSPTGSLYYTYNPDTKKVFLTDFSIKFDFNGDLDWYTDKMIFADKPSKCNRALFEFPKETYEYHWEESISSWMMEKPTAGKVHQMGFPSFLSGLDGIQTLKFLDPRELPQDAGFDHPVLRMTFSKTGKWTHTLLVGREYKPGIRYAKLADSAEGYLVESGIAEKIRKEIETVGSFLVCFFPEYGVKRIEFITPDRSFAFSRESKESNTWQFEGHPDAKVDYGAVVNIIYKMYDSENHGYIGVTMPGAPAKYGFNKPRMTIKMDFFNPYMTHLTLYYGNTDTSGKFVYSYNSQDPGILQTDAVLMQVFPKSGNELLVSKK